MSDTPLHLVLLEFADTSRAAEHMEGHNQWIDRGFADGVVLFTGTMPGRGGTVLLHGLDRAAVDDRVALDPFVAHSVVTAQVIEIQPSWLDPALDAALA